MNSTGPRPWHHVANSERIVPVSNCGAPCGDSSPERSPLRPQEPSEPSQASPVPLTATQTYAHGGAAPWRILPTSIPSITWWGFGVTTSHLDCFYRNTEFVVEASYRPRPGGAIAEPSPGFADGR
jgi:hypothetical protein